MLDTRIFSCRCGQVFHSSTGAAPPEWQQRGSYLLCASCVQQEDADGRTMADPILPDRSNSGTAILLRSGSYLDLTDPDCSVIQPIDIAAGLRQPRFAGQTKDFYTIAPAFAVGSRAGRADRA